MAADASAERMEYHELEAGGAPTMEKKQPAGMERRRWRHLATTVGSVLVAVVLCGGAVALAFALRELRTLRAHLNATHARVRELERWQRHLCAVRHHNCPESVESTDWDWDWDAFPATADYYYDDDDQDDEEQAPSRRQRRRRAITHETNATRWRLKHAHNNDSSTWLQPDVQSDVDLTTFKPIATHADESEERDERPARTMPRPKVTISRNHQSQQSDEVRSYGSARRNYGRRTTPAPPRQRYLAESFEEEQEEEQRASPPKVATTTTLLRPTRRHLPAAHLHGDTSKYALGVHQNYHGNGHLQHVDRTYVDWAASEWMREANADGVFDVRGDGALTVNEEGLYFVYAQIFYVDEHDLNGYHVYGDEEVLLQCTTMTHSTGRVRKSNTCYTAGVVHLVGGVRLHVRDLSTGRFSIFERAKSFFGALKIADVRRK